MKPDKTYSDFELLHVINNYWSVQLRMQSILPFKMPSLSCWILRN